MWLEQKPKEGDTVKVNFAEWTKLGTKIGVFLRCFDGNSIIDFGGKKIYLDNFTTFFVFQNEK